MDKKIIGFIGLGQMGKPMALNLVKKGYKLQVFDLNKVAVDELVAVGAQGCTTPSETAKNADFVITMLPNGKIVNETIFGCKGILETLSDDALYIDMSTINPYESDEIREALKKHNKNMIDCPVGKTSTDAITGTLIILAGAYKEELDRARDVLLCMGNEIVDTKAPGMGIRLKIVNNYMSIALNALSAEAAVLCTSMGLDLNIAIDMMKGTPAIKSHFLTTWQNKVLKGDLSPAFMVDLAHKDLGIALDIANKLHVPMTMGAASREIYNSTSAFGHGKEDWTSVYTHLQNLQKGNFK